MIDRKKLEQLIDEATVDCFGPYEEVWGFQVTLENELIFPFKANVCDKEVEVIGVDVKDDLLLAICKQGYKKYGVSILKLKFDSNKVDGGKWIAAYRQWYKDNESFLKRKT